MFEFIRRIFRREPDYFAGSKAVDYELAEHLFAGLYPKLVLSDDAVYQALPERGIRALVKKYHVQPPDYVADVMDCDDMAMMARSDIARASAKLKAQRPVLFGVIEFQRRGKGRHMANVAMTADDKPMIYEPETRKWTTDMSDIESVFRVEF